MTINRNLGRLAALAAWRAAVKSLTANAGNTEY